MPPLAPNVANLLPHNAGRKLSAKDGRSETPQGAVTGRLKGNRPMAVLLFSLLKESRENLFLKHQKQPQNVPSSVGSTLSKGAEMKAKSKNKNQSLNLRNPKQMDVLNSFAISEGRLSKEDIYAIGNKDIFYRMKNGGFIKETVKGSGVFKATSKLKGLVAKTEGIAFGNGCSNKHSKAITKATQYLPKEIVTQGRFKSGQSLKSEMDSFKQSGKYHRKVEHIKQGISDRRNSIKQQYQSKVNSGISRFEQYQAKLDYRNEMKQTDIQSEIINSSNPVFIPDFMIQATRDEAQEILENLQARYDETEDDRERSFLRDDIEKMQMMIDTATTDPIDIYVEIVTDSYGNAKLERHRNYETIMDRPVIYLC